MLTGSTEARLQHDLVLDVELSPIERLLPKTKHKDKETVKQTLNVF